MSIYVGKWDCKVCGHEGNDGPNTHCTACGAPRGNAKFYLPEDAEIVTEENQIREAELGPDWTCEFCGADNKASYNFCKSCGNSYDGCEKQREVKEYSLENVPTEDPDEKELRERRIRNNENVNNSKNKNSKKPFIILAAALMIIGFLFYPRNIELKVIAHSWNIKLNLEEYKKVRESGWSLPSAAELVSNEEAIHHYDKIPDGYETKTRKVKVKVGTERYVSGKKDLGNGHFKDVYKTRPVYEYRTETYKVQKYKSIPVYKTKYTYNIMKWVNIGSKEFKGDVKGTEKKVDKEFEENKRVVSTEEKYYLILKDSKKDKLYEKKVEYNEWLGYDIEDTIKAKKNMLKTVIN